ncbi:MAG: PPC domain-containing protein, partial [Patescibacteria group bacterium]|nr:PPC domain-containing protein [Patescibacteria group bacterium]
MPCSPRFAVLAVVATLACAPAVWAQRGQPRVGYVYPAGGQRGTTFEAVVAGQFLPSIDDVIVSGEGVSAEPIELVKPITQRELNDLRIQVDELMARRAVVRDDFAALERFRSFRNAKTDADDKDADRELQELKQKYAGAVWTDDDEKLLNVARRKIGNAVRRPANPAISELAILRITITADARPGTRELRLATSSGLSNPLVFCVGQLQEFSEDVSRDIPQQKSAIAGTSFAPRGRPTDAEMTVTLPAVINGQILPGEVDRYRFTALGGQKVVAVAEARKLIPYIPDAVPGWFQATLAIFDADGKELAYEDDFRFHPDPVLSYRIPADGEYVVEIKDAIYRGREDFVYRITLGELPFVTSVFPLGGQTAGETTVELKGWNLPERSFTVDCRNWEPGVHQVSFPLGPHESNAVPFAADTMPERLEEEPNNRPADAQEVMLPVVVNGRMNRPGDVDVFRFAGHAGDEIVAEVHARRLGSPMDSLLTLTDSAGRQLAVNDDHEDKGAGLITHQADSMLRATLPADGEYFLHLSDMQHQGGPSHSYRLRISPPRPDFELRLVPSSVTARFVGPVPITIFALRRDGFAGEISLALDDAPSGFSLSGGRIPAGEDQVRLTLNLPADAGAEVFRLRLRGTAIVGDREVIRPAVPAEDMMQAFEYRHLVPVAEFRVAVLGGRRSR